MAALEKPGGRVRLEPLPDLPPLGEALAIGFGGGGGLLRRGGPLLGLTLPPTNMGLCKKAN